MDNRNAFQKTLASRHSTQYADTTEDDGATTPQARKRGSADRANDGTSSPTNTARARAQGTDDHPSDRELMSVLQSLADQMRGDRQEQRQIWEHIAQRMTKAETTTARISDRLGNIDNHTLKNLHTNMQKLEVATTTRDKTMAELNDKMKTNRSIWKRQRRGKRNRQRSRSRRSLRRRCRSSRASPSSRGWA